MFCNYKLPLRMLKIKNAEFVVSATDYKKCPQNDTYEFAFIGRSNVGKSSLINMLTNRKNLAKTSSTPGKTQLINHYIINDSWYLVDLPGYGYAKAAKTERRKWEKFISNYLIDRPNLINLFVLLDSRHAPQKIDLEFINWCGENNIPFSLIFTKIDKIASSQLSKNLTGYKKKLKEQWEELPPIFVSSSTSKHGQEQILSYIDDILKSI